MNYRDDYRYAERQYYWTLPRVFLAVVVTFIFIGSLSFTAHYLGIVRMSIFAPMEEAIRRDVMIESRAYSEATTRRLYELKIQYDTAPNDEAKAAIRSLALHEARAFDKKRLPRDLQVFLVQIGG